MLRLVEPPPLSDPALREELPTALSELRYEPPPLRLVESERRNGRRSAGPAPVSAVPVDAEGDGDLLIFKDVRSAWFSGQSEDAEGESATWASPLDEGWQAAEQLARPAVGAETTAGLPKRVPQANLVPGSPMQEERPLRIVRDAASIAAHTTGYFSGWRRGQEINGYAVGGRPGRQSEHGWDFTRDQR